MKNVFNLIAFAFILLATSCSKESAILPPVNEFDLPLSLKIEKTPQATTTLFIQVEEVTNSQVSGEFLVSFSCQDDLTGVILENTQTFNFTDGNGNTVTLTFAVNSYSGGVNSLDVAFAIGSNNLSGLTLQTLQEIIIQDEIMG